jgi:hypothetical protein
LRPPSAAASDLGYSADINIFFIAYSEMGFIFSFAKLILANLS